ncbi:hypothetical protein GBF38_017370 [Nibea albiflora]|uniref:Uncharacterized protein n=1 Tax=Nibea albiflora TaxID=240163 RepID=A0ACB7EFU5_NIBAL|nr:hypothetical protein GBF38_017370 [Nibea albiflora]
MRHSASAFGFAFDATLDVLSSIIVLWRYSNAAAVHSAHREYIINNVFMRKAANAGFNSLVGAIMGFSILISAEVFKHHADVWFLDGTMGVLIGLIILAYGVKLLKDMVPRVRQTRNYERFE